MTNPNATHEQNVSNSNNNQQQSADQQQQHHNLQSSNQSADSTQTKQYDQASSGSRIIEIPVIHIPTTANQQHQTSPRQPSHHQHHHNYPTRSQHFEEPSLFSG